MFGFWHTRALRCDPCSCTLQMQYCGTASTTRQPHNVIHPSPIDPTACIECLSSPSVASHSLQPNKHHSELFLAVPRSQQRLHSVIAQKTPLQRFQFSARYGFECSVQCNSLRSLFKCFHHIVEFYSDVTLHLFAQSCFLNIDFKIAEDVPVYEAIKR